ncbi:PEP/pyruvate-binding domain-containing protein [Kitasatospora sp. NPDC018058]|uniref:PEP/pyruvate-binding domain-containing protein n=1 Tax=Kitasatospora sp. NPDC018058 TaxID=3364025 RepID=UPI0037C119A1
MRRVIRFRDLGREDVGLVGGKNASLGELINGLGLAGVRVPDGFATTADAYRELIDTGGLRELIADLDRLHDGAPLAEVGAAIRSAVLATPLPPALEREVVEAYGQLAREAGRENPDVAVRSSATAEDLPEASFAGQQETFLNVRGTEAVLDACRRCFASLFTDRAIDYRERMGFDHLSLALSVGV